MSLIWTGFACAAGGATAITFYTIANYHLRRWGAAAVWGGGWVLGAIGMILMAVGWSFLASAGPHYDLPLVQFVGLLLLLSAGVLYLRAAAYAGRLRSVKNFSLRLNTQGIYRYLRHPQALALCLLAIGLGLTTLSRPFLWTLPLWIGYWVAYTFFEEHFELIPAYGEEYLLYRRCTPRLLPSVKAWKLPLAKRRRSFSP